MNKTPDEVTPMGYVFAILAAIGALLALGTWVIFGWRDSLEIAAFSAAMVLVFLAAGKFGLMP